MLQTFCHMHTQKWRNPSLKPSKDSSLTKAVVRFHNFWESSLLTFWREIFTFIIQECQLKPRQKHMDSVKANYVTFAVCHSLTCVSNWLHFHEIIIRRLFFGNGVLEELYPQLQSYSVRLKNKGLEVWSVAKMNLYALSMFTTIQEMD